MKHTTLKYCEGSIVRFPWFFVFQEVGFIGKNHKGGLVTLSERVSRYVLAGHICGKHAAGVTAVTKRLLRPHKDKGHAITFDNGKEFAEHELMAAYLKAGHLFRSSLQFLGVRIEREQQWTTATVFPLGHGFNRDHG